MTDISASLPSLAESDFRVGRVLNRTTSVLSRNFLMFFAVSAVAQLPTLLFVKLSSTAATATSGREIAQMFTMIGIGIILMIVLSVLSQAVVLYGAFQDMRGRRVNLAESLQVGLRRFFPIVGLAVAMTVLMMLAAILFIVPAMILFTMWFVATPACVVEQLGPSSSMRRSTQLTKGHRWKIFGLGLLLLLISVVADQVITTSLTAIGGEWVGLIGQVGWAGIWGAFYAIAVVVTYHDLRVAKEGVDIHQIAAVFE
jgi:hypothetical protein